MVDVGTIPARDRANGVVAGVAAGIARTLEVDPTLVRLLFALLTLAGGAGILLYLAAALLMPEASGARTSGARTAIGLALLLLAAIAALNGLGLPGFVQAAAALAAAGVFFFWRRRQRLVGTMLLAGAAVLVLTRGGETGADGPLLTPAAFAGGLLLIVGPWLWRTRASATPSGRGASAPRSAPRSPRACTTRCSRRWRWSSAHADDPKRVAAARPPPGARAARLALRRRRQPPADTLAGALADAAAEVEELHGVARRGRERAATAPLDDDVRAVVLAAREAMANAAKFSGADEISVYAEADDDAVSVFVRDRGAGFDRGGRAGRPARASPSRSRAGWRAPAARRRSRPRPARAPRSS